MINVLPRLSSLALLVALLVPQDPAPAAPPAAKPGTETAAKTPAPAKYGVADLAKLDWLVGTWRLQDGETVTEEHWRPLQGNTMLGSSHTFRGERTLAFEFLRLTAARGQIGYVAMPGGKAPTTFLLQTLGDGVVEFENAEHDYPQRIRYERTAKGVTATISLLDGKKAQAFVFERVGKKE